MCGREAEQGGELEQGCAPLALQRRDRRSGLGDQRLGADDVELRSGAGVMPLDGDLRLAGHDV